MSVLLPDPSQSNFAGPLTLASWRLATGLRRRTVLNTHPCKAARRCYEHPGPMMMAREVAKLLHAPVSTVEDWARRDILPSVKIGRRRLYIRQNIEAVLIGQPGFTS